MEKLLAQIGWNGTNYESIVTYKDDAILATGKTIEKVKARTLSAVEFHFEESSVEYDIQFQLRPSALLRDIDGIVKLSAIAKAGDLNEKRLGHYRQGRREGNDETLLKIQDGIRTIIKELEKAV